MKYNRYLSPLSIVIVTIVILGIFFRFFNLSWGAPYFFHPDERNIASAVSKLSFPDQLNPHFFAYGGLPIYIIYFTGVILNLLSASTGAATNTLQVSFESAIIIGRFYSSMLSVFLLYLLFCIGRQLGNNWSGVISLLLGSFCVGFLQYAHFATFEMWLTVLISLLTYFLIKYAHTKNFFGIATVAILCGLLISTKISTLIYLPVVVIVFLFVELNALKTAKGKMKKISLLIFKSVVLALICGEVVFITSPFNFFDYKEFVSAIRYESSVALGTLPVFYTQTFENSTPFIFQLLKVYPFILNPFVYILALFAVVCAFAYSFKSKIISNRIFLLIFATTFLSQVFLYVKWTRYYIPTLPFILICIGLLFSGKLGISFLNAKQSKITVTILILISCVYSFSYFKVALLDSDTRVEAADWAKERISPEASILSEVYDMGIVPFNEHKSRITLFDFYDYEVNSLKKEELDALLLDSQYIVLPSQRIIESRLSQPTTFPRGHNFYSRLVDGSLGFKKVYETNCDLFCKLLYFGDPLFTYEQTVNVFDRPTITIFSKETQ